MTREALTIRDATPVDRPAMLDLWVDAWTAVRPEIDFAARRAWLDRHLEALRHGGARVFVGFFEAERFAGFATLDPASGAMDQLVTAVWAQRRGVGQSLLRHAKRLSPGGIALTVNQFNTAAVRLYQREGFDAVGHGVNAASSLPVWHMRWAGRAGETPASEA